MKLSLVVPCYNEAENVANFQKAVIGAFDGCGYDYEIIFVDDGSRDATLHNLRKLHAAQACPVKVVSFSRDIAGYLDTVGKTYSGDFTKSRVRFLRGSGFNCGTNTTFLRSRSISCSLL